MKRRATGEREEKGRKFEAERHTRLECELNKAPSEAHGNEIGLHAPATQLFLSLSHFLSVLLLSLSLSFLQKVFAGRTFGKLLRYFKHLQRSSLLSSASLTNWSAKSNQCRASLAHTHTHTHTTSSFVRFARLKLIMMRAHLSRPNSPQRVQAQVPSAGCCCCCCSVSDSKWACVVLVVVFGQFCLLLAPSKLFVYVRHLLCVCVFEQQ